MKNRRKCKFARYIITKDEEKQILKQLMLELGKHYPLLGPRHLIIVIKHIMDALFGWSGNE